MKFGAFANPLEPDYDITASLRETEDGEESLAEEEPVAEKESDHYLFEIAELIGVPEDIEDIDESELLKNYGITLKEYLNPTAETVKKVKKALGISALGK